MALKITDMTREQLRDYMKGNGEIHRYNIDSPSWKHAFKLIKMTGLENLEMECTKCVHKVTEWLKK